MKPTLPALITSLLVFFTLHIGGLKANPEFAIGSVSVECSDQASDLSTPTNYYCNPPDWTYTYNIGPNSCTWQWCGMPGANGYIVQWRYPNGSWYNLPGVCYQTWINLTNLQSCTSYEWRVQCNCSGSYSSWCYPCPFNTTCYDCQYPAWQSCNNITDNSATWKWAACEGADYYWIQWCYQGGSWNDYGSCYGTWVNVNNLQSCTSYQWRVKSHCYSGWSNWCTPYSFTTYCNNCPAPYGPFTKDVGITQATLKWSPVSGAVSYSVQIKDNYGTWYDLSGSPTNGVWIIAYNLQPCKTYQWRVKTNCGYYNSYSYWSQPISFTTSCGTGCYAPEWVYTNGITGSSAALHWGTVDGADGYVVEWRPTGGTWNQVQAGNTTVLELNGLSGNSTYEWHVKSHCYSGNYSGWSSTTSFTTLGGSCGLPFFKYTLPITDSTATLNWTAVSGALNYSLQIRLANGIWMDIPGSPTSGTSITVTGLLPDTMYEWHMQVNCGNGASSGWLAPVMFRTGASSGCGTPGGLYADSLTLSSVVLKWGSVQGAVTYSVEMRQNPQGAWKPVQGSPVNTNSISVDSLNPFTTYEWHVRANCAGGVHSFYSGTSQFTTTNLPACDAPVGLHADSISDNTAVLRWSPVSGAQVYQVQIRLSNDSWIGIGEVVGDTSLLATSLAPHTSYEWHVRSKCDAGQFSNWSASSTFTTTGSGGAMNDDCSNALLLTVESSCVSTFASNIDATASTPPPVGGCSTNGYKDVWFKFTMPNVLNPTVTIRTTAGSLANAVMEVYSGSDCGIQSVITCEDNNDNGNGSSMPVINLTGTASMTVWVRVWGIDGSTGTFTICVFNGISFNDVGEVNTASPEDGVLIEGQEKAVNSTIELPDLPELFISPNPVSDQLNVVVRQTKESHVVGMRVVDLSGKVVLYRNIDPVVGSQFKTIVDVSEWVPGVYVLQVQTTKGILAEKITVMN